MRSDGQATTPPAPAPVPTQSPTSNAPPPAPARDTLALVDERFIAFTQFGRLESLPKTLNAAYPLQVLADDITAGTLEVAASGLHRALESVKEFITPLSATGPTASVSEALPGLASAQSLIQELINLSTSLGAIATSVSGDEALTRRLLPDEARRVRVYAARTPAVQQPTAPLATPSPAAAPAARGRRAGPNDVCYGCGGRGHYIDECPNPTTEPRGRKRRNNDNDPPGTAAPAAPAPAESAILARLDAMESRMVPGMPALPAPR